MRYLASFLLLTTVALTGCTTTQTWKLDRYYDQYESRLAEQRLNRLLTSLGVKGDPQRLYVLNGYYLTITPPRELRNRIQSAIPFVVCGGQQSNPEEARSKCFVMEKK